jgi:cytochrome P450
MSADPGSRHAPAELDARFASTAFTEDPYPTYAAARASTPAYWCEPWQAWVVTSHAAVVEVLRRPDRYSSAGYELAMLESMERVRPGGAPALAAHYSTDVLSITDPPVHTRLRRLLVASFTPRVVERLRPRVVSLVDDLLDGLDGDRVDILAGLAYPLPALVIGELLGVPSADQAAFMRWSADIVAFVGTGATDATRLEAAERSMAEFRGYLEPLIAELRARPSDDMLGLMARPARHEDELTDAELVATCVTLLFAGHETTANLIGNGLLALLRHPDQLAALRADPGLAAGAVEELLRYDSPVQRNRRRATQDTELGDVTVRGGDRVLAFLGAANRDPAVFPEPDRLDIGRPPGRHLAFGHGIHYCVGAALSRLEAPIALTAVLERYPGIALAEAPIRWKPNIAFRGLEELVVTL